MKRSRYNALLLCTLIAVSYGCNKSDGFAELSPTLALSSPATEMVDPKEYCGMQKDLEDCYLKEDVCQPAFEEVDPAKYEKQFLACVPHPEIVNPIEVPVEDMPSESEMPSEDPKVVELPSPEMPAEEPKIGDSPDVVIPVILPPSDDMPEIPMPLPMPKPAPSPAPVPAPAPVPVPVPMPSPELPAPAPSPMPAPMPGPEMPAPELPAPAPMPAVEVDDTDSEIGKAVKRGCENIDPKFLVGSKGKGQPKVMICHNTARGSHAIVIACPALKAHVSHHDDTLGACPQK